MPAGRATIERQILLPGDARELCLCTHALIRHCDRFPFPLRDLRFGPGDLGADHDVAPPLVERHIAFVG